ncbi:MAG: type II/IV secretion system protein [Candidatus Komeilibacteria bacterium]|nr:type II/IV secretion system protein [Candidatus Komeilibacteria bacterium]
MLEITDELIQKILAQQAFITQKQYDDALQRAAKTKKKLLDVILDQDLISRDQWGQLFAKHFGYHYVNLAEENIEPQVLQIVPELVARNKKIIAFGQGQGSIKVAMAHPDDLEMVNLLEKKGGVTVEVFYAPPEDIDATLTHYKEDITKVFDALVKAAEHMDEGVVSESAVITMVEKLISYAHQNNASDIHIEPNENRIVIRFRIDGILHYVIDLPKSLLDQLVSRIKVMAKLKTDEHRSAQDGKIRHAISDTKIDIRISIIPITEGEKVVMRLLSDKNRRFTTSQLGLDPDDKATLEKAARRSHGMILATGPTGSGKTTTLYSVLKMINSLKVNIATIEDPVEYNMEGVNQIQVDPKTNLTFAKSLKSILRQDPDIIMVGEIRDEETADIAINAALTGHLLLSTLHTNDAATTIPRLAEMKISPYLITSAVNLIIAQRLVRKICVRCRYGHAILPEEITQLKEFPELREWVKKIDASKLFFSGKGCKVCNNTGFSGRTGIYELLEMNEEIRKVIMSGANAGEIQKAAIANGMKTMLINGMNKVIEGVTTVEEVIRTISV